jgi:hypothetical protein
MRDSVLITVECHSGFKADEYPKCFFWESVRFEIDEIVDRWYQGNLNPDFPAANYFKVRTTDNNIYILKHETKRDIWYLCIHGEAINL